MSTEQIIILQVKGGFLSGQDADGLIRTLHEIQNIKVTYVRNCAA